VGLICAPGLLLKPLAAALFLIAVQAHGPPCTGARPHLVLADALAEAELMACQGESGSRREKSFGANVQGRRIEH